MSKKTKWISIKRFKMHEFHTTLRLLSKDENLWTNRYALLTKLENRAIKTFLKSCGQVLLAFLLFNSLHSGDVLELKIQNYTLSLPTAYFLAAASFLVLCVVWIFCHLSAIVSPKAKEHGKIIIPGFSANAYGLIKSDEDENNVTLGVSLFSNFFLKEKIPVSSLLSAAILLGLFTALLPLAAFATMILHAQLTLLIATETSTIERITALVGAALVVLSFLYAILYHLPLPITKNQEQIRWNFLSQITSGPHPQASKWRKERQV